MKRADSDELTSLLLENDVLSHHIDDVSPLLDGVDRAGMQACVHHGVILRRHAVPSSDEACNRTTGGTIGSAG